MPLAHIKKVLQNVLPPTRLSTELYSPKLEFGSKIKLLTSIQSLCPIVWAPHASCEALNESVASNNNTRMPHFLLMLIQGHWFKLFSAKPRSVLYKYQLLKPS